MFYFLQQSYRGRSFFSTSTEDTTALSGSASLLLQDENKKQSKQRWSGFFSNNKVCVPFSNEQNHFATIVTLLISSCLVLKETRAFSFFLSARRTVINLLELFFQDTKMESLADQLNYYSQHESFKTLISEGQDDMVNALYNLEEDWREILEPNGK